MRILIFGRVGQLGSALAELLSAGHQLKFLDQPEIDLAQTNSISRHISRSGADLVINAAAYTAVDKAQSESELAQRINADAPAAMAKACHTLGVPFIHFSTDYVFDGEAQEPYHEESRVAPRSVYGETKLAGERAVALETSRHVILRTAWLYSHVGHNFLKTMLRLAGEAKPLRVVSDQFGSPTFAWDLGAATARVVDAVADGRDDIYGVFHATNSGQTSWFEFARAIFETANLESVDISPITTAEYPTPAPRPAYSVLSCERLALVFGIRMPSWQDGLARCVARL